MSLIKKFKMKKLLALTLAAFMSFTTVTAMPIQPVNAVEEPASLERQLIPLPVDYEVTQDKFTISEDTNIYVKGLDDEQTDELYENVGEYLASKLRPSTGYELPVIKGDNEGTGNIAIVISDSESDLGEEGYKINTTVDGLTVTANQPAGAFRAVQTVRQLLPADIEKRELVEGVSWDIPCSNIDDKPEYEYRGSHLDVTRHFFSVEDVKRYIDNMAQYKMNKLHLHLSDDQGWRLEIKGSMYGEDLSKLNTIGAQTSTSINGIKAGQYTQEDYKELVAYAADRYIEIIPEFDMPGHSWAALVSLNFLNSTEDGKPHSGNYDNTKPYEGIDVGFSTFECRNEKTYEFIDEVFRQVAEISPSKYIHIGGDEAHSTSSEDYAYFMNRVTEIAQKYGKIPIGWQNYDNVVEDKEGTVTQFWSTGNAKMKEGLKYLISPADYAYMDMKYDANCPFGLQWAGYNSIEDTYSWDPTNYGDKENIVGIEACIWTETIGNAEALDYMVYPKILSHAEIGWTPKELRSWEEYKPRLIAHGQRLENQGIDFYKDEDIWEVPYEEVNATWNLDEGKGNTITDTEGKYTGTFQGEVGWIDGVKGNALDFNRKGYVDLGLGKVKGDWTVACWVKNGTNPHTNAVLFGGSEGDIKLEQYKNTKKLGVSIYGVVDSSFDYSLPEGEWKHVAFVGDSTGTSLYVDGQYIDKVSTTINCPVQRIGAAVNNDINSPGNMSGSMDELNIYNRALEAEEIKAIYDGSVVIIEKETLKAEIDAAESLEKDEYTEKSWKELEDALAVAKEVYANDEATQSQINSAYYALVKAREGLKKELKSNEINIASFNIAANRNPNIAAISDLMEEKQITVAGVQEVDVFTSRNNYDMMQEFVNQGYFGYSHFQKAIDYGGGEYGVGIVSQNELSGKSGASLPSLPGIEGRAYARAEFEKDGKTIAIYSTHLSYENSDIRRQQIETIINAMDADPTPYKILTGDFNTGDSNSEFYPFLRNYNIANGKDDVWLETIGDTAEGSRREIDNIITTRNIKINTVETVNEGLSDHYMLYAQCELLDEEVPNRQLLGYTLEEAESLPSDSYTEASYAVLAKAIEEAKALAADATQDQINAMIDKLEAAMDQLVESNKIINDSEVGTGVDQFNFVGEWGVSQGYPDRFYNGDEHWFNWARYQEGDIVPYFTITFEGTGIELYGNKDTMMGIYDITVDDGEVIQVDAYNPSTLYQQLLFSVTGLEYGQHTIKVSATRNKNENSTSSDIEIDYAKILYDQDIQEVDKTALKIAVDLANAVTDKDLEKVIPVVANEFKAARDEANAVYNNASATQDEVNAAFDRLASAMHMLDFVKGDKTALKAFIDDVTGLDSSKYSTDTWAAFETELNEANVVYNDENAMQEEVNNAYKELVTAFLNLRLLPDKSLLEDLINQAEGLNGANYTKASFDGLTKALNEAKAVYENPNATQEEVDNAKATLEKAIAGLQANPSTPSNVDNTVSTPLDNGDTTASVKTGDGSLVGMFATIALLSVAGYTVLRRKEN